MLVNLEETALVDDQPDHLFDVVGLAGIVGHEVVERLLGAQGIVLGRLEGRVFHVILRHIPQDLADQEQGVFLGVGRHVAHAADGIVRHRAAQLLEADVLVSHRADHVGAGHEHIRCIFDHKYKVGQRRAVNRPTRARPHDHAELGNHAAGERVAQEDVRVAAQADDALLNPRSARIVQADDGRAILDRHIQDLADFLGMGFAQRAAHHGEILGVDVHQPPIDRAPARDHAVA